VFPQPRGVIAQLGEGQRAIVVCIEPAEARAECFAAGLTEIAPGTGDAPGLTQFAAFDTRVAVAVDAVEVFRESRE
jgi:hypothetical protein